MMRIAVSGPGVAGPGLAWWLRRYGHEPVLFEKATKLRAGGYLIDSWGVGYDSAEKTGLTPALREKGYLFETFGRTTGTDER
jgi:2-polyprenyl-6-methoxyphenol hydroxylase-like FAD-dependent oxidoreductase